MTVTYEQVSDWLDALLQLQDEIRALAPDERTLIHTLITAADRLDDLRRDFPEHATSEGSGVQDSCRICMNLMTEGEQADNDGVCDTCERDEEYPRARHPEITPGSTQARAIILGWQEHPNADKEAN